MQTIFSPMGGIALILGFTFVLYAIVWPFIRTTVFSKPNFLAPFSNIASLLKVNWWKFLIKSSIES